jgi:hypothetical protein
MTCSTRLKFDMQTNGPVWNIFASKRRHGEADFVITLIDDEHGEGLRDMFLNRFELKAQLQDGRLGSYWRLSKAPMRWTKHQSGPKDPRHLCTPNPFLALLSCRDDSLVLLEVRTQPQTDKALPWKPSSNYPDNSTYVG